MKTKIPPTKPGNHGYYALHVDGDLVGFFRRFDSAWRWMEYLYNVTPRRMVIEHKGTPVNVRPAERAPVGDLTA